MNTKQDMYNDILQHGRKLNKIFDTGLEPITLCKKLRRLEIKAHKLATDYCNGENGVDSENWEEKCGPILKQVIKILNQQGRNSGIPIFINGDARGYALKIPMEAMLSLNLDLYKDWGGYGILALDFRR